MEARMFCLLVAGLCAAALLGAPASAQTNINLRKYNVDSSSLTVSGLSAGAFFAAQFHVAFSDIVHGAAVFAGGPFYCSQGSEQTALTACMAAPEMINIDSLVGSAKQFAALKQIPSLDHLKNSQVFLYSGMLDTIVQPGVVRAAESFYQQMGANTSHQYSIASQHCMPSNSFGNACPYLGSPFVSNCNYDGAGQALAHLYSGAALKRGAIVQSNLFSFDQSTFIPPYIGLSSLALTGYIYIPTACQNLQKCKLHVAFAGCEMTHKDIGNAWVLSAGYNQWAEASNIIVVYPQTVSTLIDNPKACLDWWGYTGPLFATGDGVQMAFVRNVIRTVAGF